ncbi:hypothetical protein BT63DRAFT_460383 [Microthyrium microscopicum]|uniref:Uncharacterized protein n=1 Tax=Microthyrium microscopicum TaxID=703497 RepID=A0A6A6TYM2_9PEZI|nr:hypothetical protein BT63DRAFT_460383 [Microthyrium microscopicum]
MTQRLKPDKWILDNGSPDSREERNAGHHHIIAFSKPVLRGIFRQYAVSRMLITQVEVLLFWVGDAMSTIVVRYSAQKLQESHSFPWFKNGSSFGQIWTAKWSRCKSHADVNFRLVPVVLLSPSHHFSCRCLRAVDLLSSIQVVCHSGASRKVPEPSLMVNTLNTPELLAGEDIPLLDSGSTRQMHLLPYVSRQAWQVKLLIVILG